MAQHPLRRLAVLHLQTEVDHFREEAFVGLVVLLTSLTGAWAAFYLESQRIGLAPANLLLCGSLVAVWLIIRLYRRRYLAATTLFVVWQIVVVASMVRLTRDAILAALFALPIFTAGVLIGPVAAFGAALLATGSELLILYLAPSFVALADAMLLLAFQQGSMALVAWLASTGFYNALDSAAISAQRASGLAEEARWHRAELQRTLLSVDRLNYQLRRANAELFHARQIADSALRFKSQFAAQLSHEFRTSLNLILGFSETMAFAQHSYGVRLPNAYLRDITEIYRNSRHLLALVDDVLDLSKLEAGRIGLRREPVDIRTVVDEALEIVRPVAAAKGLPLQVIGPPSVPMLLLDRARVRQILLNLLHNAVRVTNRGRIDVRIRLLREELQIQVQDTGPGIAPENLSQIFEEFVQIENTSGSAGLGLAVSKQIVHLHGGRIWAESQVGRGTTFYVAFPIQKAVPLSPVIAGELLPPAHPPQPAVIVIGNDTTDGVRLLERHLDGYAVTVVSNWEMAAQRVGQVGARAVIADHASLSEAPPLPVPVIGCKVPGPQQSAQALQVDAFIQKPVTMANIHTVLAETASHVRSVLIVDDEPGAVRLVERMLRAAQPTLRIFRAYGGQEALARVRAQRPDMILLDLTMAEGDGQELIAVLRKDPALAEIAVVAISGRGVEEMWESGPISIVRSEGFTPTEMLNYLQALLSAVPPAPMERYTSGLPLSATCPG